MPNLFKRWLILIAFIEGVSGAAWASDPWEKPDMAHAKNLHEQSCVACHVRMYGGDGSKIYTKPGRVLSDKLEILQRVASCSSTHNAGWFPEDEGSVAAWLNEQYYHFER